MKAKLIKVHDKLWEVVGFITDDGEFFPDERIGPIELSFDKKKIYNFWRDWEKFTPEQRQIIKEWNPVLYGLKSECDENETESTVSLKDEDEYEEDFIIIDYDYDDEDEDDDEDDEDAF